MDRAEQIYQALQGLRRTTGRRRRPVGRPEPTAQAPDVLAPGIAGARRANSPLDPSRPAVSQHRLIAKAEAAAGHVFISYSHHADVEYVSTSPLPDAGRVPVWYDQEIMTGARWESTINEHIDTARR